MDFFRSMYIFQPASVWLKLIISDFFMETEGESNHGSNFPTFVRLRIHKMLSTILETSNKSELMFSDM